MQEGIPANTWQTGCQPASVSNVGIKLTDPLRALWHHCLVYLWIHLKLIIFLKSSAMPLHLFPAGELQHGCSCQVTQDTSYKAENWTCILPTPACMLKILSVMTYSVMAKAFEWSLQLEWQDSYRPFRLWLRKVTYCSVSLSSHKLKRRFSSCCVSYHRGTGRFSRLTGKIRKPAVILLHAAAL